MSFECAEGWGLGRWGGDAASLAVSPQFLKLGWEPRGSSLLWRTFDFFHNTKQGKGTFTRPEHAALGNNSSDRKARQSGKAVLRTTGEEFDVAVSRTSNVCINNPVHSCFLTQMGLYEAQGSAACSLHSRAACPRPILQVGASAFLFNFVVFFVWLRCNPVFPLSKLPGLYCCTYGLLQ